MTVQGILGLHASPMTFDEILTGYPYLEREDLLAALKYGVAAAASHQVVIAGS